MNNFVEENQICFAFNEMHKWDVFKNGYSKNSRILGYLRAINVNFLPKYLSNYLE